MFRPNLIWRPMLLCSHWACMEKYMTGGGFWQHPTLQFHTKSTFAAWCVLLDVTGINASKKEHTPTTCGYDQRKRKTQTMVTLHIVCVLEMTGNSKNLLWMWRVLMLSGRVPVIWSEVHGKAKQTFSLNPTVGEGLLCSPVIRVGLLPVVWLPPSVPRRAFGVQAKWLL